MASLFEKLLLTFVLLIAVADAKVYNPIHLSPDGFRTLSQDYPNGTSKYCEPELLSCDRGVFNMSDCQDWLEYTDVDISHTCICDPDWSGVGCSIASQAACDALPREPNVTWTFDSEFVNLNNPKKYLECSFNGSRPFPVYDSRINITVDMTTRTLYAQVLSRMWIEERRPIDYSPMIAVVNCSLSDCDAFTIPDDPKYQAKYVCKGGSCTGCTTDQGCSALVAFITRSIQPPVAVELKDIVHFPGQPSVGKGRLDTNKIQLDFVCKVGGCTTKPINNNPTSFTSYAWIVIVLVTFSVASCVMLSMCALCKRGSRHFYLQQRLKNAGLESSGDQPEKLQLIPSALHRRNVEHPKIVLSFENVCYDIKVWQGVTTENNSQSSSANSGAQVATFQNGNNVNTPQLVDPSPSLSYDSIPNQSSEASTPSTSSSSATNISFKKVYANRRVLNNVSGIAYSGEILAILGLSGSGKTTLLDILAHRPKVGKVSGNISLRANGKLIKPRSDRLAEFVSYVPSDDCLIATQTVFEAVLFSARLRLPRGPWYSEQFVHDKVESVLDDLGLSHIADSRIGSYDTGGISTGERKRVAIALELVADPLILMLDEPTSGLDSYNASLLMDVIARTARSRGLLCILSIHQPPSSVFRLFDRLLLLTRKGQAGYSGYSPKAMEYMESIGFGCHDPWVNPAEYLLSLASNRDEAVVRQLGERYATSGVIKDLMEQIREAPEFHKRKVRPNTSDLSFLREGDFKERLPSPREDSVISAGFSDIESEDNVRTPLRLPEDVLAARESNRSLTTPSSDDTNPGRYVLLSEEPSQMQEAKYPKASAYQQTLLLISRSFSNIARNPSLLFLHFAFTIIAGVALGTIFFNLTNDIGGVQDRTGFLFFMIFFFSLTSLSSLSHFIADRVLFIRERTDQYYTTLPYVISKLVSDLLPLRIIPPMIFGSISYYMIGLQNDPFNFTTFVVIVVLVNTDATASCFFISSFCSTVPQANLIAVVWFVFCMLFGGLFLNGSGGSDTTEYINWLRFLSFFHYGYDALMINEFKGLNVWFNPSGYPGISITGQVFLENLSIDADNFGTDVGALFAFAVGFFALGFIFMSYFQKTRR